MSIKIVVSEQEEKNRPVFILAKTQGALQKNTAQQKIRNQTDFLSSK